MLDTWIKSFPHDFAVPGAATALGAFVKSVLSKTYLLHYGSDFLPFLELIPTLKDQDGSWALKVDHPSDEVDDSMSQSDDENSTLIRAESPASTTHAEPTPSPVTSRSSPTTSLPAQPHPLPGRERKSSLPLTSKSLFMSSSASGYPGQSDALLFERNLKQVLKRLVGLSQELSLIDPTEIAQEITLMQLRQFQQISVGLCHSY